MPLRIREWIERVRATPAPRSGGVVERRRIFTRLASSVDSRLQATA
jgi:hypothetical protein